MIRAAIGTGSDRLRARLAPHFDRWIQRRGRSQPPMRVVYRQIYVLPTRFGWLLGLLMFGMLMGSLNFNNNLGLLTTFIVAGLAVNSMLMAYRNLHGLILARSSASPVFAGQHAELHVSFRDADGRERPNLELASGGRIVRFSVPAANTTDARLPLPTQRRGWFKPGRIRLQTSHPLGLFEAWCWFWPEGQILVWPRPADHPPALPSSGGQALGRRRQRDMEGDNFHALRAWREGDPLHRIAWKASQHHQTLLSREFREEQAEHLLLDLDRTPGRHLEEKLSILTAWVLMLEREGQQWTLRLGGSDHGPASGREHAHHCLRLLAER
ncbi:MAG: DUF58 domain-containing protein [Wenzhouxiangella sp.]|nr:DUF58 domain-containing protein [Wenzhouxiangella sp.]MCH8477312.1 DUF58 domain-containing protein [Wenzhouxiangella sp.]TVR97057.1 MAG: DUF58 domain-containing protein [Wenzhouxiangellaceae bacterium]